MRADASNHSPTDLPVMAMTDQAHTTAPGDEQIESAVRAAVAAERVRIATELRDCLSTGLLDAAAEAASALSRPLSDVPDPLRERLGELAQRAQDAVAGVQHAIGDLRENTVVDALTAVATAWGATSGAGVSLDLPSGPPVTAEVRDELAEILREALQNVARHARAARVRIALLQQPGRLIMSVAYDGAGFRQLGGNTPAGPGWGLARITERAGRLDGSLTVQSWPSGGTHLAVQVPVPTQAGPLAGFPHVLPLDLPGRPAGPPLGQELTPREYEILGLIADGLSNRQIARRLVISPKTVKNHIWGIYQRLGVHDREQAISKWRASASPPHQRHGRQH